MTPLFADTSYFIALMDVADEFHEAALALARSNRSLMLTTSAVVLELGSAFSRSARRKLFVRLTELPHEQDVEIIHADAAMLERGIKRFAARADKDWSLVDCVSFITKEDRGLVEAATTDVHFEQAGYVALLRAAKRER